MPKRLRTSDKILFILNFFGDFLEEASQPWGIFSSSYKSIFSFTPSHRVRNHFQQSLYRLLKTGLVEKKNLGDERYIRLTSLGKNDLTRSFPNLNFRPRRHWDGHWRVVSFDVGESYRKIRNLLRNILQDFGFVKFHQSLYINPQPVEEELKSYLANTKLDRFVRVFVSKAFGDDRELANNLWQTSALNDEYRRLLRDYEMNQSLPILRAGFLELASRDPYLPQELLPVDWFGHSVEEKVLARD